MPVLESDADQRPTVAAILRRAARDHPDHDYVVSLEDRLTYADADRLSAHAARWLLRRGVGKGTRVGLFFTSSVEWVVWWLAASRIGAVAVPMSTLYTPAEVAKVLRLADVAVLVAPVRVLKIDVPAHLEAALPGLDGQPAGRFALNAAPYLREIVLTGANDRGWATTYSPGSDDVAPAGLLADVEEQVTPADLAIMIHTSGTTADPKGVLHTQGTLVRQTSGWVDALGALSGGAGAPRVLCAMPFFWIGGVLAAAGALQRPATVLVLPRLDAGLGLELAERERATGVAGWPEFTQKLRLHPTFADRDLSSAPTITDMPVDLAMVNSPDGYPIHRSMTETAGGWLYTDTRIVDADGAAVGPEVVGELLIRGVGSMVGYNKRERHEVFDDDGWYHTGDRVYRKEGDPRLFYVGRETELIKASGSNVSPREVEAVIEEFPEVGHCVVVGIDHPTRGEEVCAVVVPAGEGLDVDALAARARKQLSVYKVPTRWVVAGWDEVPTLGTGKPDRRGIRALVADGVLK